MSFQLKAVKAILDERDGNWYKLLRGCWTDIDQAVRHLLADLQGLPPGSAVQREPPVPMSAAG